MTDISGNTTIINTPVNNITIQNTQGNWTEIIAPPVNLTTIVRPLAAITTVLNEQGPPGLNEGIITLIAPRSIGGHRVIIGNLDYADFLDLDTAGKVIGLTMNAADIGEPVNIRNSGELGGFSNLIINEPVYLGFIGGITQIKPIFGYCQQVGIAMSENKMIIKISEPVIL